MQPFWAFFTMVFKTTDYLGKKNKREILGF
jgi:hypothetical protein